MVRQNEEDNDNCEDVRLVPDIVLEHAKRIEMNEWRHLA